MRAKIINKRLKVILIGEVLFIFIGLVVNLIMYM